MRNFIVKHFALDYMFKLRSIQMNFTRSATLIYPTLVTVALLSLTGAHDILLYIASAFLTVFLLLGFIYFDTKPIKFKELKDKEQQFQAGTAYLNNKVAKRKPKYFDYLIPCVMSIMAFYGIFYESDLIVKIPVIILIILSFFFVASASIKNYLKNSEDSFMDSEDMETYNIALLSLEEDLSKKYYKPWRIVFHPIVITVLTGIITYLIVS